MKGPPHKIQDSYQSKTKHLHHTKRTVHKGISHLKINKCNIFSKLDSTTLIVIDLQVESQLSSITSSRMTLKAMVQEAHKEE